MKYDPENGWILPPHDEWPEISVDMIEQGARMARNETGAKHIWLLSDFRSEDLAGDAGKAQDENVLRGFNYMIEGNRCPRLCVGGCGEDCGTRDCDSPGDREGVE